MITPIVIAFALFGMFAATLITVFAIHGLIRHFRNWRRQCVREQEQEVSIAPRRADRVIGFYIPANYRGKVRRQSRIYNPSEAPPCSKQLDDATTREDFHRQQFSDNLWLSHVT
jgi:hypothetical protein